MPERNDRFEYAGKTWRQDEFRFCISFDAFRIGMGGEPKYFSLDEVKAWLDAMTKVRT